MRREGRRWTRGEELGRVELGLEDGVLKEGEADGGEVRTQSEARRGGSDPGRARRPKAPYRAVLPKQQHQPRPTPALRTIPLGRR